jgi:hypothetical protein
VGTLDEDRDLPGPHGAKEPAVQNEPAARRRLDDRAGQLATAGRERRPRRARHGLHRRRVQAGQLVEQGLRRGGHADGVAGRVELDDAGGVGERGVGRARLDDEPAPDGPSEER